MEEKPMHPTPYADQLLFRDVQAHGGVPALASPVAGRHTTSATTVSFFPAPRDPSSMSSSELASIHPSRPRIHDRALWAAAQQLLVQHLPTPSGDRCSNPGCAA